MIDLKSSPAFTLLCLQSFQQVEERYRRGRSFTGSIGNQIQDCSSQGQVIDRERGNIPARTDQGDGLGRDDVCDIVIAIETAKAVSKRLFAELKSLPAEEALFEELAAMLMSMGGPVEIYGGLTYDRMIFAYTGMFSAL